MKIQRLYLPAALWLFVTFFPSHLHGQALQVTDYKNLELVAEYAPVNVITLTAPTLTKASLQKHLESLLQSKGINSVPKTSARTPVLYVQINIVGQGFSVSVEFHRYAVWPISDGKTGDGFVTTWSAGSTGTYKSGSEFILASLDERIYEFMTAYLKANQD